MNRERLMAWKPQHLEVSNLNLTKESAKSYCKSLGICIYKYVCIYIYIQNRNIQQGWFFFRLFLPDPRDPPHPWQDRQQHHQHQPWVLGGHNQLYGPGGPQGWHWKREGKKTYCWWKKSGIHQLRLVVFFSFRPIIYKVLLYIPVWCRSSEPSTVWESWYTQILDISTFYDGFKGELHCFLFVSNIELYSICWVLGFVMWIMYCLRNIAYLEYLPSGDMSNPRKAGRVQGNWGVMTWATHP